MGGFDSRPPPQIGSEQAKQFRWPLPGLCENAFPAIASDHFFWPVRTGAVLVAGVLASVAACLGSERNHEVAQVYLVLQHGLDAIESLRRVESGAWWQEAVAHGQLLENVRQSAHSRLELCPPNTRL